MVTTATAPTGQKYSLTPAQRRKIAALLEGVFVPAPDQINDIYAPYLYATERTQIFYGGAGSGKSVFLAQRAVMDIVNGGRNYLICREVARTIRNSVFNEVRKAIIQFGFLDRFQINKSDMVITCDNGYQILFAGLSDTERIKSITPAMGVITDIWIEEATEADRRSVRELIKRQRGGAGNVAKRLTLSFNPILHSHWIFAEYFAAIGWADGQTSHRGEGLSILKSWYIHNRFLTAADVTDLLDERDEYYRNVYTFGNWGVLGNVIFRNWEVRDLSGMREQFTNRRYGLDFGFSADPAAIVASHYDRKNQTLYIFDELQEAGLTNDLLAAEALRIAGRELVVCDSAEPKSIAELARHGVNATGAAKGPDSVLHGIQWLQQQRIVVDTQCVATRNELQQYKWAEDRGGNALRRPVDRNNHLIDALRYATELDATAALVQPLPVGAGLRKPAQWGGRAKWGRY